MSLPVITITRLRPSSVGVLGSLVAVTVPGRTAHSVALVLRIVARAITTTSSDICLENIFFDFTMTATSAEIVVSSKLVTKVDDLAHMLLETMTQAARVESEVVTGAHPVGMTTHRVKVIS